ncbi:hypothetical protein PRIPAC_84429 [Pristionchus pacificus]|uniref:TIL domain-containing protein n=1 Tax=Pristionchus pacificus TaxID=54126 RepID=A0A454XRA5_PRIPA|nr:hypothetical protein PRIPAC_84429 [Pristionchus pacificus]|eukprot:PDM69331.1 hypothetical protein PRIPAC_47633 [Pristionchus pacificus]
MHRIVSVSLLFTLVALICADGAYLTCSKANEEWRECASCEATCEEREPICIRMCKRAACQCKAGFFRSANDECVTAEQCDQEAYGESVKVDDSPDVAWSNRYL